MCGIAGILTFNDAKLPLQNIRLMTQSMRHRGPDDEGIAVFGKSGKVLIRGGKNTPESVYESSVPYTPEDQFDGQVPSDAFLTLGHTRLSILDLSAAGHQPMCTEDKRYWIVHNGEVYNFKEVRDLLLQKGESFTSNTDTEVILKAYRVWGPSCLDRFNGMWAFAIWDSHEKKLFCSRDRLGIKPFYYYQSENYFLFASDIKALIASRLYRASPDWEGIYHSMSFYCAPRPMTCFKGIKALEQAHWMKIDPIRKIIMQRYWHIPVGEIVYGRKESEWKEVYLETLQSAVKRRLVADVPVGVFLSGGVDSTTLAALASQQHSGIKAYTLTNGKEHPELDETSLARATAAMWPMEHVVDVIEQEEAMKYLMDMIRCHEEPFFSLSPNFMMCKTVAERDAKVVLWGLGPDELLCGYGRDNTVRLWSLARSFSGVLSRIPFRNGKLGKLKELSELKDVAETYLFGFSTFTEQNKKDLFRLPDSRHWNSFEVFKELYKLDDLSFKDPIEALGYFDTINYIGNHHLYRNDQFTMRFSLEGRFPFLDHELVELSCRMPSNLKVRKGVGKYMLKQVAKNFINQRNISSKKKGFGLPVGHWIQGALRNELEVGLDIVKKTGVMHEKAIEQTKTDFLTGKFPYHNRIWFLGALGLWLKEFGMEQG
jgi:asparagine synthase (glutamine-hydrolysing)